MSCVFHHGARPWRGALAKKIRQDAVLSLLLLAGVNVPTAMAQSGPSTAPADKESGTQSIVVTGTRLKSLSVTATSPVAQTSGEQISLWRAATVEDFSARLPQLAGGVSGTSVGSDAFGAQTLDLRNLGQSRTLVLINGTRAVPFSIRNAVDVNFVPATLIKRVDVLTGGAAAVYGADAVAGVVNFIMNDRFEGVQAQAGARFVRGGASQYSTSVTAGLRLGQRSSLVGYAEITQREGLVAGQRAWALANPITLPGSGGNFTDVASGNRFSVDAAGQFTLTPQRSDYTPQYSLVMPLERLSASAFFNLHVVGDTEAYGRLMFSNAKTTGAPRSGQAPATVNSPVSVAESNPFIPAQARPLLTFVNGAANVNIERSLGELGVMTADNNRNTGQAQFGLRGALSDTINWDVYTQVGQSDESITVFGDGVRARFASLVNSTDLFGPGADLSSLAQPWQYGDRLRRQSVSAATLSGDSSGWFKLPAGPLDWAVGLERRIDKGQFDYNQNLGQSFAQGVETPPPVPPRVRANELYAEFGVPLLSQLPWVKSLTLEAAVRRSAYEKSVGPSNSYTSDKVGGAWVMNDSLRWRATRQSVIREPNFGEFANPVFSIPFSRLVTVARLRPRYQGDPCVIAGSGADLAQCQRFGAPAVGSYDSLDPALLTGGYFFGGNPEIRAEVGKTNTFGLVATPAAVPGLSVALDVYNIKLSDAVGQVQPVDALASCYIEDPRADNPLCAAITRDPATGRIRDGFPVDRNLALIQQKGVDVDLSYRQDNPFGLQGQRAVWQYQASFVRSYKIQRNPVLPAIDCKGTYGSRCSSDSVSLVAPAMRHRAGVNWQMGAVTTGLGWQRIGSVRDSAATTPAARIPAQNLLDVNLSWRLPTDGVTLTVGVDNLLDKNPPTLDRNAGSFNTFPDTYNVLGRSVGVQLVVKR
jgi:iron complex outermembrane recepter protein